MPPCLTLAVRSPTVAARGEEGAEHLRLAWHGSTVAARQGGETVATELTHHIRETPLVDIHEHLKREPERTIRSAA